jgi:pyrroloquinoline quinone biosynthesis protein D
MRKIRRNRDAQWREEVDALAEAREALDRGDDAGELGTSTLFSRGNILSLNVLGTEIWKLCNDRSVADIVAELLPRFEVEEDVLRADVLAFIDELAGKGFVTYEK